MLLGEGAAEDGLFGVAGDEVGLGDAEALREAAAFFLGVEHVPLGAGAAVAAHGAGEAQAGAGAGGVGGIEPVAMDRGHALTPW